MFLSQRAFALLVSRAASHTWCRQMVPASSRNLCQFSLTKTQNIVRNNRNFSIYTGTTCPCLVRMYPQSGGCPDCSASRARPRALARKKQECKFQPSYDVGIHTGWRVRDWATRPFCFPCWSYQCSRACGVAVPCRPREGAVGPGAASLPQRPQPFDTDLVWVQLSSMFQSINQTGFSGRLGLIGCGLRALKPGALL